MLPTKEKSIVNDFPWISSQNNEI